MIPDEFRSARLALGLTTGAFASALNVSTRTLQRYEDGTRPIHGGVARLVEVILDSAQAREICGLKAYPKPQVSPAPVPASPSPSA